MLISSREWCFSYTDEEVERSFEDFYEDVHTEFLKFGEIVNFKVCKNSSSHLRGNVYVHYKSLESAVLAYQSINGRYFAGKQISCEFVNVMRWRVAICGEYMKSRLKTCSRGSACNFIHCFRNPGGDYEWADWDKPAPRYWLKKMASLFGYTADRLAEEVSPSYGPRKSRSGGPGSAYGKSHSDEDDDWKRERHRRHRGDSRERIVDVEEEMHEGKINSQRHHCNKHRKMDTADMSDGSSDEQGSFACRKRSRKRGRDSEFTRDSKNRKHESEFDKTESVKKGEDDRYLDRSSGSSRRLDRHSRDKVDAFDLKENSHAERHHEKYLRHKSKHSVQRKEDTDSSDVDSYEGRHDREKHRLRSHSKRSSRDMKYDAEFSDNPSDRDIGRDGTKHQKNGRSLSSKNEPDLVDIRSNSGRHRRDKRSHGHRRRSSRHHSGEESGLSNVNSKAYKNHSGGNSPEEKDGLSESHICGNDSKCSSCGIVSYEGCDTEEDGRRYDVGCIPQIYESNKETTASQTVDAGGRQSSSLHICGKSKSELEQAYRLAALKKLEEMKKSQDSRPDHNSEHGGSARNNHDCQSVAVQDEEVSKGPKESLDSSKVKTKVVSTKRRRI